MRLALENGVTKEELIEAITHLAFYGGWPNSVPAVMTAKEVSENTARRLSLPGLRPLTPCETAKAADWPPLVV